MALLDAARRRRTTRKEHPDRLTEQQDLFFTHWKRTQDVNAAALCAGYSTGKQGYELAKKPHIAKLMEQYERENFQRLADRAERVKEWNDNELLTVLVAVSRNDFLEYYQTEPYIYGIVRVKPLDELSYTQRLLIENVKTTSLKIDKETNVLVTEYEFLPKQWAIDKLAQTFGTYKLAEIAEKVGMSPETLLGHKINAAQLGLNCD